MKRIISIIIATILGFSLISAPAFAAKKGDSCKCADGSTGVVTVDTNILSGCDCSGGNSGGAVKNLFIFVADILSIGVGVLGVIGISIVGIQYLTAGGNEEKTRKAKRRMFEIVIGVFAYSLLYTFLKFFLSNFNL